MARLKSQGYTKSDIEYTLIRCEARPLIRTSDPSFPWETSKVLGLVFLGRPQDSSMTEPREDIFSDALSARLLGRPLAGCDGAAVCALSGVLSCPGAPSAAGGPLSVCEGQNRLSGEVWRRLRLPHALHAGPFALLSVCT